MVRYDPCDAQDDQAWPDAAVGYTHPQTNTGHHDPSSSLHNGAVAATVATVQVSLAAASSSASHGGDPEGGGKDVPELRMSDLLAGRQLHVQVSVSDVP